MSNNEHSFDRLSRELADATISRRRALRLVGAAILGSFLVPFFPAIAQARRRPKHRRRRRPPIVIIPEPFASDLCTNPIDATNCMFTTTCLGCQQGQICRTSGCSSGSGKAFCYPLVGFPSNVQLGLCGGNPDCSQLLDCTTQNDCPAGQFCSVTCCPTSTAIHGGSKCIPSCSSASSSTMATITATEDNGARSAPDL